MSTNISVELTNEILEICKKLEDPDLVTFNVKRAEDKSIWGQAVCFGSLSRLTNLSDKGKVIKELTRTHYQKMSPESLFALVKTIESSVFDLYKNFAEALVLAKGHKKPVNWAPLFDYREEIACVNEILRYNETVSFILRQFDDWCQAQLEEFDIKIKKEHTPILDLARRAHNNWWLGI